MIEIKATLSAMDDHRFQCDPCLATREPMLTKNRQIKGCWEPVRHTVHKIDSIEFKICPGNFYSYQVIQLFSAYKAFDKGTMPYAGNYMEQPVKVLDIFSMIESYRQSKLDKDIQKRKLQEKVARKNGR